LCNFNPHLRYTSGTRIFKNIFLVFIHLFVYCYYTMETYFVIIEVSNNDRQYLSVFRELSYIYTCQHHSLVILIIDDYFLATLLLCCSTVDIVIFSIHWLRRKNKSWSCIAFMYIVILVSLIGNIHLSVDILECKMDVNTIYEWVVLENIWRL
jgi:hypothetical protein